MTTRTKPYATGSAQAKLPAVLGQLTHHADPFGTPLQVGDPVTFVLRGSRGTHVLAAGRVADSTPLRVQVVAVGHYAAGTRSVAPGTVVSLNPDAVICHAPCAVESLPPAPAARYTSPGTDTGSVDAHGRPLVVGDRVAFVLTGDRTVYALARGTVTGTAARAVAVTADGHYATAFAYVAVTPGKTVGTAGADIVLLAR